MLTLPKRRRPSRMGLREESQIRCPGHLKFVRGFRCILGDTPGHVCEGLIRACHIRTGTDGGMGVKPSDCWTYPGCDGAHGLQHQIGEAEFERRFGLNLKAVAEGLWSLSPHGRKYRMERA